MKKKCRDNTTLHQLDQKRRRRKTYEQIKDYLNAKK
jgi:hypothetical protein